MTEFFFKLFLISGIWSLFFLAVYATCIAWR